MARLKLEEFKRGPFFGFPNLLERVGDKTVLHAHRWDHILFATKSVRVRSPLKDTVFQPFEFPVIIAGVEHEIEAVEPDTEFACIFALWQPDENGIPFWVDHPLDMADG